MRVHRLALAIILKAVYDTIYNVVRGAVSDVGMITRELCSCVVAGSESEHPWPTDTEGWLWRESLKGTRMLSAVVEARESIVDQVLIG